MGQILETESNAFGLALVRSAGLSVKNKDKNIRCVPEARPRRDTRDSVAHFPHISGT